MRDPTQSELLAATRELVEAAEGVRNAVESVALAHNVVIMEFAQVFISAGLLSPADFEGAVSRSLSELPDGEAEGRICLLQLLAYIRHRAQSN